MRTRVVFLALILAAVAGCDKDRAPAGGESEAAAGPTAAAAQEATPAESTEAAEEARPAAAQKAAPAESTEATEQAGPAAADARVEAPEQAGKNGPAKAEEREKANSWWHVDGVAEALKLSEEQRQQMDQLRGEDQERKDTVAERRRELDEQLEAAFVEGDLEAAGKLAGDLENHRASEQGENAFKLEILSLLSQEQMDLLTEKYPRILSKTWRRNTRRLVEAKGKSGKGRGERGDRGKRAKERADPAAVKAENNEDEAGKDD